ncbi:hypothetical protein ACFQZI_20715 [Mucilaginibacter lutimaris]|uniref:Uncharacterized protein n=1 Tax=Mucilaginibacter lutimaris TaxID=931629 RepID=A0ABW2ZM97_9SPHI
MKYITVLFQAAPTVTSSDSFKILIPTLLGIASNLIFYLMIKNGVDSKLEKLKISYSGIFQQRIEIYKEILRYIIDIQKNLEVFEMTWKESFITEIMQDINGFIRYIEINKPFISEELLKKIELVKIAHKKAFDSQYLLVKTRQYVSSEQMAINFSNAKQAFNKIFAEDFNELKAEIVNEMRAYLVSNEK